MILAVVLVLLFVQPAAAEIFKYRDASGKLHFTDKRMGSGYALEWRSVERVTAQRGGGSVMDRLKKNRSRYSSMIERAANKVALRPALLHAVIRAESAYDARAVSSAGAVGLMQLMPATAAQFGVRDLTNPVENIRAGSLYLKKQLDSFKDLSLALAAYNAGGNAVRRYGNKIPPYPETQRYVKKVLNFYKKDNTNGLY